MTHVLVEVGRNTSIVVSIKSKLKCNSSGGIIPPYTYIDICYDLIISII
jgi:hypothetical protein